MKLKITLLFLVFSLSSFTGLHKFYVSVTEIEYNEETRSLQIISRVFIDDLEDLLKKRYNENVQLGKKNETKDVNALVKKYFEQKLKIEVNGKPVQVQFLGKEYENDMLLLYLEAPNVSEFKEIKVKNTVLMDLHEEQKNLIHVEFKNVVKSLILISGKEENVLNFNL